MEEILRSPIQGVVRDFGFIDKVNDEAQFLRRGGTGTDSEVRELIDWNEHFTSGLLRKISLTEIEEASFVALAQIPSIDDGEARCLAVAGSRGWGFVSDDIPARKHAGDIPVFGTPDIVRNWADYRKVDELTLSQTLRNIKNKASYGPPRAHPLRKWWLDSMKV